MMDEVVRLLLEFSYVFMYLGFLFLRSRIRRASSKMYVSTYDVLACAFILRVILRIYCMELVLSLERSKLFAPHKWMEPN